MISMVCYDHSHRQLHKREIYYDIVSSLVTTSGEFILTGTSVTTTLQSSYFDVHEILL